MLIEADIRDVVGRINTKILVNAKNRTLPVTPEEIAVDGD